MPRNYETSDAVAAIASGLIPNYHPELAEAKILYIFVDKGSAKNGRAVLGTSKKLGGFYQWALEQDFVIEVALDKWNELNASQRTALIDHLLERCLGEEDDEGVMSWRLREPETQEFATILGRHGAWNAELAGFVSVAKKVDLKGLIDEVEEVNLGEDTAVENRT